MRPFAPEVGAGIAAYNTIQLNPMLQRPAIGLAIVVSAFAAISVMGSRESTFRTSNAFIRNPVISLLSAVGAYCLLQLAISYFDAHPPYRPWATVADLVIQCLYATTFALLTVSCCSLLRGIGIHIRAPKEE